MSTETAVSELDQLAYDFTNAKVEEAKANEARLEIERKLLKLLEMIKLLEKKDEGTVTVKTDYYKISATFGIDRKVDSEIASSLSREMDEEQYRRLFKWTPGIDLKELRYLEERKPEVYRLAAKAITAKSKKPSLKVEGLS